MFFPPSDIHHAQDPEKSKVLQSIASVIQAMPPIDEIPVIEVSLESTPTSIMTNLFFWIL